MTMGIDQLLSLDKYELDESSHISIDEDVCKMCSRKYCLTVCPAHVYSLNEMGVVVADHAGCLECGTCIVACELDGLSWHMPNGGMGVSYRYA